jgi:putative oxidoreductase
MADLNSFSSTWSPRLLSILRFITTFLFLSHGSVKLFGKPAVLDPGLVPLFSILGLAGVLDMPLY